MQIIIDTHKFVKFLSEEKHFTQKQAEVLIEAATEYHNAYTKELATKQDLQDMEKDLHTKIDSTRKDLGIEIDSLRIEIDSVRKDLRIEIGSVRKDLHIEVDSLKKDIQSNFYKTVIALGSINVAVITIALAVFSIVK